MTKKPITTMLSGFEPGKPPEKPEYIGDKVAGEILSVGGNPLPTGAITTLTHDFEQFIRQNPKALPIMHATLAVLQRINNIVESNKINHGEKPIALWKSLGGKLGRQSSLSMKDIAIVSLVEILKEEYWKDLTPNKAQKKAREEVAQLANTSFNYVKKIHNQHFLRSMDINWENQSKRLYLNLLKREIDT